MAFIRRFIILLTALCLLLTAAEAGNVGSSLVVGIQSSKTLAVEPLMPVERDVLSIYNLVYESLITIDDSYLPQPCLAESWEYSGGGKTWTFKLRKNAKFSDGTPMTANDVVATANYILNRAKDEAAQNKGYYVNLKYFVTSISAKDDYTVTVKAARSYFGVLYAMTFPVLKADEVSLQNPLGTGPYRIERFDPSEYFWLEVNEHWWQNQPQVKNITAVCHAVPKDVISAYELAQVDTVFTRAISASQYRSSTSSFAMNYRTNQLECLLMNHSSKPLNEVDIRKAIRYLVDPDKIASTIYNGMVERTNTPLMSGTWMYNDAAASEIKPDKQAAINLLTEAGWSDTNDDGVLDRLTAEGKLQNLHLRLYVYEEPDNDVRMATATYISDVLKEVGISVKITAMSMTEIQSRLSAGSYDLALVSYAMDVCPDPGFMLMKGNTGNYCRYKSNPMTDLCNDLRKCVTQQEYQQKLYAIQQKFVTDCPFICLFYRSGTVLTRYMYTTARDVRELELLRGIEVFTSEITN